MLGEIQTHSILLLLLYFIFIFVYLLFKIIFTIVLVRFINNIMLGEIQTQAPHGPIKLSLPLNHNNFVVII